MIPNSFVLDTVSILLPSLFLNGFNRYVCYIHVSPSFSLLFNMPNMSYHPNDLLGMIPHTGPQKLGITKSKDKLQLIGFCFLFAMYCTMCIH